MLGPEPLSFVRRVRERQEMKLSLVGGETSPHSYCQVGLWLRDVDES